MNLNHWGRGRFCLAALDRMRLTLKVLWLGWVEGAGIRGQPGVHRKFRVVQSLQKKKEVGYGRSIVGREGVDGPRPGVEPFREFPPSSPTNAR